MKKICGGLLFVALTLSLHLRAAAQEDEREPPVCELEPAPNCQHSMFAGIGEAARTVSDGFVQTAKFTVDIATTRAAIQHACAQSPALRDHPERIPQTRHFIELLEAKDLYFISVDYDPMHAGAQYTGQRQAIDKLVNLGGSLDGGQRELAGWDDFVRHLNEDAQRRSDSFAGIVENMRRGDNHNSNEYRRYAMARNLLEFNAIGCNVTADPQQLWLDSVFSVLPSKVDTDDARAQAAHAVQFYAALKGLYGEDALAAAARRVVAVAKDPDGGITVPPSLHLTDFLALGYFLGKGSLESYTVNLLYPWEDRKLGMTRIEAARDEHRELLAAYGQAAVDHAAQQIRDAPRDNFGYALKDPQALGIATGLERPAFFDLLALENKGSYLKAVLAFHDHLTTPLEVDSAYAKLTASHDAATLQSTADSMVRIWTTYSRALAPADLALPGYESHLRGKYADDYDTMTALLSGKGAPVHGATAMVSNPGYTAWSRFAPGTAALYALTTWTEENGQVLTFHDASRNQGSLRALEMYRLTAAGPAEVTVSYYSLDPSRAGTPMTYDSTYPAQEYQSAIEARKIELAPISVTTGTDTLRVNGHAYACTWEKKVFRTKETSGSETNGARIETVWRSSEVPGGMVMKETRQGTQQQVRISQTVYQKLPVAQPEQMRNAGPVAFNVISQTNPSTTQEVTAVAASGPVVGVKLVDGKPVNVPGYSIVHVELPDGLTTRPGDAQETVMGALSQPIRSGSDVLYPKGTPVRLTVTPGLSHMEAVIGPESILVNGTPYPFRADPCTLHLRPLPHATDQPTDFKHLSGGMLPAHTECPLSVN